ncbi:uncharacterized protein LOC116000824 isoform X3 [Ipomoea triloba]|uniref:uncharacterized protein LOC116000824 isoform X3 n=1 Tax=Ipomoea triloba TaxID=35885 RepID=UPI00125D0E00|nr:uncharacterized protein LOC116000824 isoform X3 [Ipomoea triloba]
MPQEAIHQNYCLHPVQVITLLQLSPKPHRQLEVGRARSPFRAIHRQVLIQQSAKTHQVVHARCVVQKFMEAVWPRKQSQ